MGFFSWLTCDTQEQIRVEEDNIYVLVPKEFGGGHIAGRYDGYGNIGICDIYELVAEWNREYLDITYRHPNWECERNELIKEISLLYMKKGEDAVREHLEQRIQEESFRWLKEEWKRAIGIEIACYDADNIRLPYPIKISKNPEAVYEDYLYSPSDPKQGCN